MQKQKKYFTPRTILPGLRRVKLIIAYDGAPYHGWQTQKSPPLPTVQGALEEAFGALTQTKPEALVAAGRTDKGVHAKAMVCHLDTFHPIDSEKIKTGLNRHLPNSIAVLKAADVDQHFHARYCCTARAYEYRILNTWTRHPLEHGRAALIRKPLDIATMKRAAAHLIGTHDFSAFRSSECQAKTAHTTLHKLEIFEENPQLLTCRLEGITFLHNMVRILVGTLVEVGHGRKTPEDMQKILQQADRTQAGKTMPAHGLYFSNAFYKI